MSNGKRRHRAWRLPSHAILHWWDLHSWAGVVGGLILYIMFAAGATTLFHHELEVWEEPIHQRTAPAARPLEPLLAQAYGAMRAGSDPRSAPPEPAEAGAADGTKAGAKVDPKAPSLAAFWFFPPHPGRGEAAVAYQDGAGTWHTAYVDSSAGAKAGAQPSLIEPRERLAHFLYALHYLWHDLTGQWLYIFAGILAVAFLLVVLTGVLVHLKNLKKQFHQFRPKKSRHALWADLHKVLGVLGLPFQIMYAYTGAMLVLGPLLGQLLVGPLFGGDERRAAAVLAGASYEQKETSGKWLHTVGAGDVSPRGVLGASLDELIARAQAKAPRMEIDAVQIVAPGYSHGYVEISGYDRASSPHGRTVVTLRSATAEELSPPPELQSPEADTARRWVRGLHFSQLGGFGTRALLFLLTLAGCATILSGNALWLVRREERSASASNRILAKLTVGVGAGLWVAFGAIFVASRALPWGLEGRGAIEELIFLGTLVFCIGWAMVARSHAHTWWRQLVVAAVLLAAVPLLAALHSSAGALGGLHVPDPGAPRSAGMMVEAVGVDIALWAMAILIAGCAWWLRRVAQRLDAAAAKKSPAASAAAGTQSPPSVPGLEEEPS